MEISVPARGSARTIVREMIKHLCSSISYGGAASLRELREKFWADPDRYLIKLSSSSRRESYDRYLREREPAASRVPGPSAAAPQSRCPFPEGISDRRCFLGGRWHADLW